MENKEIIDKLRENAADVWDTDGEIDPLANVKTVTLGDTVSKLKWEIADRVLNTGIGGVLCGLAGDTAGQAIINDGDPWKIALNAVLAAGGLGAAIYNGKKAVNVIDDVIAKETSTTNWNNYDFEK